MLAMLGCLSLYFCRDLLDSYNYYTSLVEKSNYNLNKRNNPFP
jgi:hypothetical protein